jgi:hypothetical protein
LTFFLWRCSRSVCDSPPQVEKILDPSGYLDSEWEDCVFDDYGRAFCTENPWSDPGILQRRLRSPCRVLIRVHLDWDPDAPVTINMFQQADF